MLGLPVHGAARCGDVLQCLIARQRRLETERLLWLKARWPWGEGTGATVRESLLSNGKKINIDILTSQQNSTQGFCWIFPWGEQKNGDTHSLLVIHLYWNELPPPPPTQLGLCVVNTESPNVCILLILLCLAFPRLFSVTLCSPPAVVNTTLLW